jgi:ribonuclease BN (tRNA processing enzyme)
MYRTLVGLSLLVFTLSCAHRRQDPGVTHPISPGTGETALASQIVLLGTGTPNADPDRSGPAVAIVVNGTPYLVDCGPGVVRRAAAAHRQGVAGLAVENLARVFVTHLHSDHTVGYPDLILTPWVLGREEPLQAYGPVGLAAMTEHILRAYEQDIRVRIDGLEPANTEGYKVTVHEIETGIVYEDQNVRVKAFPVRHGAWEHAFGFRFETPDRTIVVSGDTVPSATLIEEATGCDVLIHEVYSQAGFDSRPPEWQRYHADSHTSSTELAKIAKEAKPQLLILYHQLFWGTTEAELLAEIRQIYSGQVVSGDDLDVY